MTAMVAMLERHAEDASMDWVRRELAVRAPHYSLTDLLRHDRRLVAHLDGLRVDPAAGFQVAWTALERWGEPGEAFVASALASDQTNSPGHRYSWYEVVELALREPENGRAVTASLGWWDGEDWKPLAESLLADPRPAWRKVGLAAFAIRRVRPDRWDTWCQDPNTGVRRRAVRSLLEIGRPDDGGEFDSLLRCDTDPEIALAAELGALLFSNPEKRSGRAERVWERMSQLDRADGLDVRPSAPAADRRSTLESWRRWGVWLPAVLEQFENARLVELVRNEQADGPSRRALAVTLAAGLPNLLDGIVDWSARPEWARGVGEVFQMMLGINLESLGLLINSDEPPLAGPTEDPVDEDTDLDPDERLPVPDAPKLLAWWRTNGPRWNGSHSLLAGGDRSNPQFLLDILQQGNQRQRRLAAGLLRVLRPDHALFPTSAPARRQQQLLDSFPPSAGPMDPCP